MTQRSTAEKMLLILSAFAFLTITPFVYIRWVEGDMVMAAIDAILSLGTAIFFVFVFLYTKNKDCKIYPFNFFLDRHCYHCCN